MNIDKYEEVINGEDTYKKIAEHLKDGDDVLIGWTDGEYDHRDIFFSLSFPIKYGIIQRGIKRSDLFVGIIGDSFYGFKTEDTKHPSYILEKLILSENDTNLKMAELINGIIVELNK